MRRRQRNPLYYGRNVHSRLSDHMTFWDKHAMPTGLCARLVRTLEKACNYHNTPTRDAKDFRGMIRNVKTLSKRDEDLPKLPTEIDGRGQIDAKNKKSQGGRLNSVHYTCGMGPLIYYLGIRIPPNWGGCIIVTKLSESPLDFNARAITGDELEDIARQTPKPDNNMMSKEQEESCLVTIYAGQNSGRAWEFQLPKHEWEKNFNYLFTNPDPHRKTKRQRKGYYKVMRIVDTGAYILVVDGRPYSGRTRLADLCRGKEGIEVAVSLAR